MIMDKQQDEVAAVEFGKMSDIPGPSPSPDEQRSNLEMIFDIPVTVTAEMGSSMISIKDLLNFSPGSVIELDRLAGESIDLLVNGVLIGKGDVVIVNENFGIRVTEIVCIEERIKKLSD
jgi:flagellar motor switch protein FliN/FliY